MSTPATSAAAPGRGPDGLWSRAGLRVYDGFGGSLRAACRFAEPGSVDELVQLVQTARDQGLSLSLRGAGRSYGDAALDQQGLLVDTRRLDRLLSFDPARGVAVAEPGLPLAALWRAALPHGFWPAVVPGTMAPTLGGCAAMNVHGKNNFKAGVFGEQVLSFDLLCADGRVRRCTRESEPELFHAALGAAGMLGVITRLELQLKPVASGRLRVLPGWGRSFEALFALFDERLATADYLVGWVDCFATGRALGRGQIHEARHLHEGEDPAGRASLQLAAQELPARILGFPKAQLWRLLRLFNHDPGMRLVNLGKSLAGALLPHRELLQSHVAFAFLLDYVPGWRRVYGVRGFLQHQLFLPDPAARLVFPEVLRRCQARGVVPYLAVLKRHRPDPFLLSHGLDGWSLALDFPIGSDGGARLRACADELTALALDSGGRFYLAKDQLLTRAQWARSLGDRLPRFEALRRALDPQSMFGGDQARRLFG